jgi:hypothetical protein
MNHFVFGRDPAEVPRTVLLTLKGWEQEERKSAIA